MLRLVLVLFVFASTSAAIGDEPVPNGYQLRMGNGLVGYWPFEDSGKDTSGNKYDLKLEGGATFTDGKLGRALFIPDKPRSYAIRDNDDPAFNFGDKPFTIQLWVNFKSLNGEQNLVEKFAGDTGPGWTLLKKHPTYHDWQYYPGGLPSLDEEQTPAQVGVWQHVVVRRARCEPIGKDKYELFIDGKAASPGASKLLPIDANIVSSPRPLLVGIRWYDDRWLNQMNGAIDELAIWNRGLSDEEIKTLYINPEAMKLLRTQK
jgi:hypothetical protein